MRYVKLPEEKVYEFLERLKGHGPLYAPVKVSEKCVDFREIDDVRDVVFNYTRTLTPPKKYFFPPKEIMFRYDMEKVEMYEPDIPDTNFTIFGVHHCDIVGLRILDTIYMDDMPDIYYTARRTHGIIIGISCMPDEYCFCNIRRTDFADKGFDLFLHEVKDGYMVRVGSVKGHKIVDAETDLFTDYTHDDIEEMVRFEAKRQMSFSSSGNWDNMRYILELKLDHPAWERESEKCLGCGLCTLVCPTCRCYDVRDIPELDGKTGVRIRRWDSCQYWSHGLVAGGHNFRESKIERFKNRYLCKNAYCAPVTTAYCVGCGRCTYFCPAGIDFKKVLMEIRGEIEDGKRVQHT